jgi:Glutamine synthetase
MNGTFYEIDSEAGWWNTGEPVEADGSANRGYKVRPKGGYFPVAPYDHFVDLRDQMCTNLQNAGFTLERGHHEVGTAGQAEINYKFNTLLPRLMTWCCSSTSSRTRRGRPARP